MENNNEMVKQNDMVNVKVCRARIREVLADIANACDGFYFQRDCNVCCLMGAEEAKMIVMGAAHELCDLIGRVNRNTSGQAKTVLMKRVR